MSIVLYNTLTRKKEIVKPREKVLKMFVCGPTTYNYIHAGNAKTYTQFDMAVKYFRHRKLEAVYVQNITDIDDKILNRAKETGEEPLKLSERFYQIYIEDMKSIGNNAVSKYVKATERIKEIISQVERLMKKGYAYKTSDGVYFDLSKFPEYGKLSGRTALQAEDATSRIDQSEEKRNKGDFCVWKFAKEGGIFWNAPFGGGRPGWHIEDTAITEKEFGPQYDVHGGGVDLIFPHHEAEIAQMEAVSGKKPFVKYWMHTGLLDIKKEKMSKSKGNVVTLHDLLKEHDAKVVRFFFIASHYRSRIEFSEELLEQAKSALARADNFIQNLDKEDDESLLEKAKKEFYEAMDDDLNTPKAFAALFNFINKCHTKNKGGKKTEEFFKQINEVFGIFSFKERKSIPQEITKLAEQRQEYRKKKYFAKADEMRKKIEKLGFLIEEKGEKFIIKTK